jgi:hypothetical protein
MRMAAFGLALLGCFMFAIEAFRYNLPFSPPSDGTLTLYGGAAFVAALALWFLGERD